MARHSPLTKHSIESLPNDSQDHPGLSHRTTKGVAWSAIVLLFSRIAGVVSQVILAFYLVSEDFGAAAFALALATTGGVLQGAGLREVLLPRKNSHVWEGEAVWIALILAITGILIAVLAATISAQFFSAPGMISMLAILCIQYPIRALGLVPALRLQRKMAFKRLSIIELVCRLFHAFATIIFAVSGFKAYSLILPIPMTDLLRTVLLSKGHNIFPTRRPRVRRWRYLMRANAVVMVGNAAMLVTRQADYLILGFVAGPSVLGYYFFAYNLSTGIVQLFSKTVADTLFISLTRLSHDSIRQTQGFLRAARVLLALSIPLCMTQFVLAADIVPAVWGSRWTPSVIYIQILSLGLAIRLITPPAFRYMQASMQYSTYMWTAIFCTATFLPLVICLGYIFGGLGIAIGVSIHAAIAGLVCLWVVCKRTWRTLIQAIGSMLLIPFLASSFSLLCTQWFLRQWSDSLSILVLLPMICIPIYVGIYWCVQEETYNDIRSQFRVLASSVLNRLHVVT